MHSFSKILTKVDSLNIYRALRTTPVYPVWG